ncbi:choice-of-anchor L domain-containing protein [Enhygromyxa salina]|uniref:choice-of-anchor L domain-containing protein n=1 Tax=Enhygromyxa salina TaxID=215803 RepID=UPI0015E6B93C|nr:choice-of-anchor L domain-containing protein [Enhygromyxa salina]
MSLLTLAACSGDDVTATGGFSAGETNTGDGDGDGDGDSNSGESGETNGNSGDGDGDPGDGDGDPGDGDSGDGDGDGDGDAPCMTDADCPDANNPICDAGECWPCTPQNDICDVGQYCSPDNDCVVGCIEDEDCPDPLVCDVNSNTCTGCVEDQDCPLGSVCEAGDCNPGCTDQQPCQNGFSCCGGECENLADDPENCGECDNLCPDFPNAEDLCTMGGCDMGDCEGNWNDCNGNIMDGCETQAMCACVPGEEIACYTGFPGNTEGVGLCHAGTRTCNMMGTGYGACLGQVIPAVEICSNGMDENCNGQVDENPDLDGDGWGVCDNDCCDQVSPDCSTPALVNRGAFEVAGNNVDDDCDGVIDNPIPLCDNGLASNSNNALDYARAVDLCQFTTENPQLSNRIWGVISAFLRRANDSGSPNANSRSIRPQFGTNNLPQKGQRLAVMSSGYASYPGAVNPSYFAFETGQDMGAGSDVPAPADWVAANGGQFPNAPGCPGPGSTTAFDSVMFKVRVRVPTNANSFSTKMYFFSAEYPEYVCTAFNDMFVTLVNSTDNGNPNDKNIAIYAQGNNTWPVGVNLVSAAPGLFTQCDNGNIGCAGGPNVPYNGCVSELGLLGTGFDAAAAACNNNNDAGGGTGWLTMSGNVTPGETMEIRFVIWDSADSVWDSLVLLDSWEWSVQAASPGVTPG